jgi:hypothetical protein
MKKILQDKKAKIAILLSLIFVSLAEILFRAIAMGEAALSTANAGEQITIIIFASIILFFTAKNNDKISYICCGVLIAYFVMDQLFEFPGMIGNFIVNISEPVIAISIAIRLLTMIGVIAISALLVEYVNDGSIYNRAFNVTYWITILLHVADILFAITGFIAIGNIAEAPIEMGLALLQKQVGLIIFNDVYRIIMVVLFTSFAYDSAKRQLKRESLTK